MEQPITAHDTDVGAQPHGKATSPVLVWFILAGFTIIEVAITLLAGIPRTTAVPILLSISFVKASLVALYYMHLRYEKWIYGFIFIAPAAFAIFLLTVLLTG
jgi:caa(3)-type oxidase subunit IV